MWDAADTIFLHPLLVGRCIGIEIDPDEFVMVSLHSVVGVDIMLHPLAGWAPDSGKDGDDRLAGRLRLGQGGVHVGFELGTAFREVIVLGGILIWAASVAPEVCVQLLVMIIFIKSIYFVSLWRVGDKYRDWLSSIMATYPPGSKPPAPRNDNQPCPHCNGSGETSTALGNNSGNVLLPCPKCNGSGRSEPGGAEAADIFRKIFSDGPEGDALYQSFKHKGFGQPNYDEPQRGSDLRYDLEITPEEAAAGCTREVEFEHLAVCQTCAGSGSASHARKKVCQTCGGRGQIISSVGFFQKEGPCTDCNGRGGVVPDPCKECSGSGSLRELLKVLVKIPPGLEAGSRLRSRGNGDCGSNGGLPGDLYMEIRHKPSTRPQE